MEMKKLTVPTHKELFIKRMQEAILSGELAAGTRIPPERELAEKMGVSRAVINAGIIALVSQGFLEVQPRQGTFVADYRHEGSLETLNAILDLKGDIFSDREIRSILEIRWALEHLTLKNTIERSRDEDLCEMHKIVEAIRGAADFRAAAEEAFCFQKKLAMVGDNEILAMIITSFRKPVVALWTRFCSRYGSQLLYEHTLKSLEYIRKRDYEGAVRWLDHIMQDALEGETSIYNR